MADRKGDEVSATAGSGGDTKSAAVVAAFVQERKRVATALGDDYRRAVEIMRDIGQQVTDSDELLDAEKASIMSSLTDEIKGMTRELRKQSLAALDLAPEDLDAFIKNIERGQPFVTRALLRLQKINGPQPDDPRIAGFYMPSFSELKGPLLVLLLSGLGAATFKGDIRGPLVYRLSLGGLVFGLIWLVYLVLLS
jgi:hypothetical protein